MLPAVSTFGQRIDKVYLRSTPSRMQVPELMRFKCLHLQGQFNYPYIRPHQNRSQRGTVSLAFRLLPTYPLPLHLDPFSTPTPTPTPLSCHNDLDIHTRKLLYNIISDLLFK